MTGRRVTSARSIRSDTGAASGAMVGAGVLMVGVLIWLAVGIPYNMLWLAGIMFVGALVLGRVATKADDAKAADSASAFLDRVRAQEAEAAPGNQPDAPEQPKE